MHRRRHRLQGRQGLHRPRQGHRDQVDVLRHRRLPVLDRAPCDDLRPLVDSGQVQLGNHTWDHPDLRSKSARDVASQLNRCETFLHTTFGVTAKPFVRPPYGFHTAQTDAAAAAEFGTMVLWLGSLGDSSGSPRTS